jgi:hypothetical protein
MPFHTGIIDTYIIFYVLGPLTTDLFSSVTNRTTGKFKVKRQRIEPNINT